jgi:hypothetical protein
MADLIHTTTNGELDSTSEEDIRDLLGRAFDQARPVALHIHGGLVKREDAKASTEELQPFYEAQGIFPVFLIWETGLFESLRNWTEVVSKESVFEFLPTRLTKFLKGRLSTPDASDASGAKAAFGAEIAQVAPLCSPASASLPLRTITVPIAAGSAFETDRKLQMFAGIRHLQPPEELPLNHDASHKSPRPAQGLSGGRRRPDRCTMKQSDERRRDRYVPVIKPSVV